MELSISAVYSEYVQPMLTLYIRSCSETFRLFFRSYSSKNFLILRTGSQMCLATQEGTPYSDNSTNDLNLSAVPAVVRGGRHHKQGGQEKESDFVEIYCKTNREQVFPLLVINSCKMLGFWIQHIPLPISFCFVFYCLKILTN